MPNKKKYVVKKQPKKKPVPKTVPKKKPVVKKVPQKEQIIITAKVVAKKKPKIKINKQGIKVIPKNNVLRNKSENWLQKSKVVSTFLDYAGMTNPVAKFGSHYARVHGYGRKRIGGGIRRNIYPSVGVKPVNISSDKPSWKTRAKTTMSKYGKYAIPIALVASMAASRGVRHNEIPFAGDVLRQAHERFM